MILVHLSIYLKEKRGWLKNILNGFGSGTLRSGRCLRLGRNVKVAVRDLILRFKLKDFRRIKLQDPMNHERKKHKWLAIMFFMITGGIFGLCLYLITADAMNSEALAHTGNVGVASGAGSVLSSDEPRVRVVLRRDVKNSFGKVDVIYRGIENNLVKLDVFIRDLDPGYPYRREIAYRSAKDGFRLGGVRFELISAGRTKAKLVWIRRG